MDTDWIAADADYEDALLLPDIQTLGSLFRWEQRYFDLAFTRAISHVALVVLENDNSLAPSPGFALFSETFN